MKYHKAYLELEQALGNVKSLPSRKLIAGSGCHFCAKGTVWLETAAAPLYYKCDYCEQLYRRQKEPFNAVENVDD